MQEDLAKMQEDLAKVALSGDPSSEEGCVLAMTEEGEIIPPDEMERYDTTEMERYDTTTNSWVPVVGEAPAAARAPASGRSDALQLLRMPGLH